MTIIEGIGDEVTHFFGVVLLILIGCAAWWTTNISERPAVRTIFLLDRRRVRNRLTNHTETVTIVEGRPTDSDLVSDFSNFEGVVHEGELADPLAGVVNTVNTILDAEANTNSESSRSTEEEEQGIIIEAMDENTDVVRQRRCTYFENRATTSSGSENGPTNSKNTGKTNGNQEASGQSGDHSAGDQNRTTEKEGNDKNIRIKLKYINDDLKQVDGYLQEKLGDFKRRHFQVELSSNKLVRLIFNGQVLQPDTLTLKNCGLFDNCVVHCLVHQNRQTTNEDSQSQPNVRTEYYSSTTSSRAPQSSNNNNAAREWDLGNFLFAILSFGLASAWYMRYMYAHLYTISATIGLTVLTTLFAMAIIGIYSPTIDLFVRNQRRT